MSTRQRTKRATTPLKPKYVAPDTKPMSDRRRIAVLAIGDLMVFLIFATIGRKTHGELLQSLGDIFLTALPFMAGWFIVAPFAGAYRRGIEANPRLMLRRTIIAWIASWPVAMMLRAIFVDHAIPPLAFWIVALISNAVLLLVWRWPFAVNNELKAKRL